jgi:hypothetical protein
MFPHFYLPEDSKTGKNKLYKNEDEVWNALKEIRNSGKGLSSDVHRTFKGIIEKILSNQGKKGYHPLDFPIVRYFLHPYWADLNLPFVQHPDFVKDIRCLFGNRKTQEFFKEINAERPDQFYLRIHSLRAVWECAKFLEKQSAEILEFHSPGNNRQGADVIFEWDNTKWHGEVKNLSHKDINLFCIAQMLSGMMYLEHEGTNLRQWNNITIEGENIDDTFRKISVEVIRKELNDIFDGLRNATGYIPKVQRTANDLNITATQVKKKKIKVEIQSQLHDTKMRKITLILQKWTRPNNIQNYYTISPSQANFWPKRFNREFCKKLIKTVKKIGSQRKLDNNQYLGFLYLDLHEENIDQRKKEGEKQEWEDQVETYLNKKDFPLVLMTDSTRLQKSIYLLNKTAVDTGFIKPR